MGATQSKTENDTINWNNIRTDDMSSESRGVMPDFRGLSNEAKQLIASLDIPEITETETSEFNYNNILNKINSNLNDDDKMKFQKILEQVSESESFSATSPFISNEMYDNLVNSKTSDEEVMQQGGSRHMKKRGGADDDSDTSSTSLDSDDDEDIKDDDEDILDSNEEKIKKEKAKKDKKDKKKQMDSEMSGGDLSYLSSSAHTGGEFSEEPSEQSSQSEQSVETTSDTQESVADEKKEMEETSISVRTEDINMVSDY